MEQERKALNFPIKLLFFSSQIRETLIRLQLFEEKIYVEFSLEKYIVHRYI